jgi:hypothetical protein
MAAILEAFTQALSPSLIGEIGKAVGLKPGLVSQGMGTVGPLVTMMLANKASTTAGLSDLMRVLPREAADPVLGNVATLAHRGSEAGAASSIFSGGSAAIGSTLDRALGFRASALLSVAAPLALAAIGKITTERQLDAQGVLNLLITEAAEFQRKGGVTARLVREALTAGREASDIRAKYSAAQWDSVRLAPVAAAHVVMTADRSAPLDPEINAASEVIDDAKNSASPTSVLNLAFEDDFSVEEFSRFLSGRTPADSLATVRDAVEVVERNSPTDAPQFRRLVTDVAKKVASASKRGSLSGASGASMSAAEQAALEEVRAALGGR